MSRCNAKLDRLVFRTRDPPEFVVDALVTLWGQLSLIYAFLLLQFLPHLLFRIQVEGILVNLIALAIR